MNIVTEKRTVAGTLLVANGLYAFPVLMNGNIIGTRHDRMGSFPDTQRFLVVDGEGFENWIAVSGPFIYIPLIVREVRDVKVVLNREEAQDLDKSELFSDEPVVTK